MVFFCFLFFKTVLKDCKICCNIIIDSDHCPLHYHSDTDYSDQRKATDVIIEYFRLLRYKEAQPGFMKNVDAVPLVLLN